MLRRATAWIERRRGEILQGIYLQDRILGSCQAIFAREPNEAGLICKETVFAIVAVMLWPGRKRVMKHSRWESGATGVKAKTYPDFLLLARTISIRSSPGAGPKAASDCG